MLGCPQSVCGFPDKQMNGNAGPTSTHSIKQPGLVLRAEWTPLLPTVFTVLPGELNQVQRRSHVAAWPALWVTIGYFPRNSEEHVCLAHSVKMWFTKAGQHLQSGRRWVDAGSQLAFPFVFSPGPQPIGCCCLILGGSSHLN